MPLIPYLSPISHTHPRNRKTSNTLWRAPVPSSHLVSQPNVFTWATDKYHTPRGELPQPPPIFNPLYPPEPQVKYQNTSWRAPSTPIPSHPNLVYSFEPQVKIKHLVESYPHPTLHIPTTVPTWATGKYQSPHEEFPPLTPPRIPTPCTHLSHRQISKHLVKSSPPPPSPLISQHQHPPEPKGKYQTPREELPNSCRCVNDFGRNGGQWMRLSRALPVSFFFTTNKPGKTRKCKIKTDVFNVRSHSCFKL